MGELRTPRSRAVKISEQCRVVLWTESTGTIFWASTSRRGVFIAGHQSSLASLTKTPTKDPIEGLAGWSQLVQPTGGTALLCRRELVAVRSESEFH